MERSVGKMPKLAKTQQTLMCKNTGDRTYIIVDHDAMSPLLQKQISQTKLVSVCKDNEEYNNWSLPPPTYGVKHNIKERKRDKMNAALYSYY